MTWTRRAVVTLGALMLVLFMAVPSATAAQRPAALPHGGPASECSADFYHGDRRLGPARLPVLGTVGAELRGYQRTGGMSPARFLATYYDPAANDGQGGWRYPPPDDGYVITPEGRPLEFPLTLLPGQDIDRFGSEYGSFLAPDTLPYAARSLPPASLDGTPAAGCNYHEYRVLKSFSVDAGPIAPWFGQPGGGLQYQLDPTLVPGGPSTLTVQYLVTNSYLARTN
jgi:Tuberculosis necrotizing toxin